MTEKPKILVVGSVNMDLVVRAGSIPIGGETVLGSDFVTSPGGKGANQAVSAARLGADVRMIGRVGDDAFGQSLRDRLDAEGVDTRAVLTTADTPSGVAMITVDDAGENAIVVASGANFCVTPDDVAACESLFEWADAVLLQLELPIDTVAAAANLAKQHNCLTILDPAPAVSDLPEALYAVDVISPNVSEGQILTGQCRDGDRAAELVAADLLARGAKMAVLKLGASGSLAVTADGETHRIAPFAVEVVDTTAAGDCFTAALAVALSRGESLPAACLFANACGALACTTLGAQSAAPTADATNALCGA
jgi:ribokinase